MTTKKTLKKRVRDRQAHTGESYTAALAQVLAHVPGHRDDLLVELIDLTTDAARLGFHCHVAAWPDLAARADLGLVLQQLRAALVALCDDPAIALMRAAVLEGIRPPTSQRSPVALVAEAHQFAARVRAGVGGSSTGGSMLAFQAPARHGHEMVVCRLRLLPESLFAMVPESQQEALRRRYSSLLLGTASTLDRPMWFLVP
jgi:hypothetical protein